MGKGGHVESQVCTSHVPGLVGVERPAGAQPLPLTLHILSHTGTYVRHASVNLLSHLDHCCSPRMSTIDSLACAPVSGSVGLLADVSQARCSATSPRLVLAFDSPGKLPRKKGPQTRVLSKSGFRVRAVRSVPALGVERSCSGQRAAISTLDLNAAGILG